MVTTFRETLEQWCPMSSPLHAIHIHGMPSHLGRVVQNELLEEVAARLVGLAPARRTQCPEIGQEALASGRSIQTTRRGNEFLVTGTEVRLRAPSNEIALPFACPRPPAPAFVLVSASP